MKYRIPVFDKGVDKVYTLETVRFLADQILSLGVGVNFSYIEEKLVFFCDYVDQARKISFLLNSLGYEAYYFFNEEIKL